MGMEAQLEGKALAGHNAISSFVDLLKKVRITPARLERVQLQRDLGDALPPAARREKCAMVDRSTPADHRRLLHHRRSGADPVGRTRSPTTPFVLPSPIDLPLQRHRHAELRGANWRNGPGHPRRWRPSAGTKNAADALFLAYLHHPGRPRLKDFGSGWWLPDPQGAGATCRGRLLPAHRRARAWRVDLGAAQQDPEFLAAAARVFPASDEPRAKAIASAPTRTTARCPENPSRCGRAIRSHSSSGDRVTSLCRGGGIAVSQR